LGSLETAVRTIPVAEVRLGDDGRLLVVPDLPSGEDLAFIYRAATEISWDKSLRALASPSPRPGGWSYVDWFRQIARAVVDEYGAVLAVGPGTRWFVPEELRREIESANHR
jgi:hypothetical protein